jgi:hypothetical protein
LLVEQAQQMANHLLNLMIFASAPIHQIACWAAAQTRSSRRRFYVEEKTKKRTRNMQINIRVSPEEKDYIMKKFAKCGHDNFNLFAIKMLITGNVNNVDMRHYHELAQEVNRIGVNINQIAKFVNGNGRIYAAEMEDLQQKVGEIWQLLKSSLSAQR